MIKFGIVFSGGGGKGAYEIGVWKALTETNLAEKVEAVAGTSVGALNAALFMAADVEVAEKLWTNLDSSDVLQVKPLEWIRHLPRGIETPSALLKPIDMLADYFGAFSRQRLREIAANTIDSQKLSSSDKDFYVCALQHPGAGSSNFLSIQKKMNGLSKNEMINWLMASSAIPVIFPPEKIGDYYYSDGGIDFLSVLGMPSNNFPWEKLVSESGCTHIICVHLDRTEILVNEQKKYPSAKFINIVPQDPFKWGAFAGLNFDHQVLIDSIARGYEDGKRIFSDFLEFVRNETHFQQEVVRYEINTKEFRELSENTADTLHEPHVQSQWELQANLLESERKLIDSAIESFASKCSNNSVRFQEMALMGISALCATEGPINHRQQEGILSRFWHGITGSGLKTDMEINLGQNQAIYATQQMIKQLSERFALSFEAISAIQSRLNFAQENIIYLHQMQQKHQDILMANQRNFENFAIDVGNQLLSLQKKIASVAKDHDLLEWTVGLPAFLGNYKKTGEKVIAAARGYYEKSGGCWDVQDENAFRSKLHDIFPDDKISLKELSLCSHLLFQDETTKLLPENDNALLPVYPVYAVIQSEQSMIELKKTGFPLDALIPAKTVVMELIHAFRMHDVQISDTLRPAIKESLSEAIDFARKTDLQESAEKLQSFIANINDFKIVIPLIGKFSSGKSRLLNTLLGAKVFASDQNPTTAVAAELHYSERNYAEGVTMDGRTIELPFEKLSDPLWTPPEELLYMRCFVNNAVLQKYEKILFVDMPGFESGQKNHEKAIARYIEKGNIFLVAFSIDVPFDDSSINRVLAEVSKIRKKPFHCILTKCDKRNPTDQDEIVSSMQRFLVRKGADKFAKIIKTSADENNCNLGELYRLLNDIAGNYDQAVRSEFISVILTELNAITGALNAQINDVCINADELKTRRRDIEKEIKLVQSRFSAACSEFRNQVTNGVQIELRSSLESCLTSSENEILDAAMRKDNSFITSLVRPVIQTALFRITQDATAKLQNELHEISVSASASQNLSVSFTLPEMKEGASGWGTAGIGVLVGTIFGPIGMIVGGIVGKFFGNNKEKQRESNLQIIRNEVIPQVISHVISNVSSQMQNYCRDMQEQLQNTLTRQIDERKEQLVELDKKLLENRQHAENRKIELQQYLLGVKRIQGKLEIL